MRCEEAREALGLLVLGALEPEEATALDAHLSDCGECSAERHRLARVVELLPHGLTAVMPPAALHQRLLSRVQGQGGGRSGERDGRRARRWPAWAPAAAAAAVLLGTVPVVASLLQREQAAEASLQEADRRASVQSSALASLANGSGSTLGLHATSLGGRASGVFKLDPSTGDVVMIVYDMPSAPAGHAYQGWMHRGSDRISIGLFRPAGANAPAIITLKGQSALLLSQVDGFGVTLEPLAGSSRPTTPPLLTT